MVDSVESQQTVRLLMALWDGALTKGELIQKVKKSGEKAQDCRPIVEPIVEKLVKDGAIAQSGEKRSVKILLLEPGKQLLGNLLSNPKFEFSEQIGKQIGKPAANVLLAVMRSQATVVIANSSTVEPIQSYDGFKTIALETFDRLNQDFNMDNLVPIYRIRRAIGDRVTRTQFNNWLLKMQSDDILQLLEGTVEDSAPDKIEDSITNQIGKLRCYAKQLAI
jgi:hypothetical protein